MITIILVVMSIVLSILTINTNGVRYYLIYAFIHISVIHLIVNVFMMLIFGLLVENSIGSYKYITLILSCILLPILPFYSKKNIYGLSGIVVAVQMYFILNFDNELLNIIPYLYIVYCYIADKLFIDNVAHKLHGISVIVTILFKNLEL